MRIGCIYTVRNEEDLIARNIGYHRCLGVTDFFVFLDHSTDRTKDILEKIPGVRCFENLGYSDLLPYNLGKPGLDLDLIREKFAKHNGIRQVFHANAAMAHCIEEGIDWLLHIDPDELVCIDPDKVEKDGLKRFLAGLDSGVGAVIFRNLEVLQTMEEPEYVFQDRLFKNCALAGEYPDELPRTKVLDPYSGEMIPAGWFWGHTSGKLAARVSPEAYFTILTHNFHAAGRIITADYLLHYNIFSFRHFLNKYRNFENFPEYTSLGRKVRPLRTLFVRLANDESLSEEDLAAYYRNQLIYTPEDIAQIRSMRDDALIEIGSAAEFFKEQF